MDTQSRVCDFIENSVIRIKDAFNDAYSYGNQGLYRGQVEVHFKARNPATNEDTGLSL